jgi:ATP-binding cassette subfamily F protein 3
MLAVNLDKVSVTYVTEPVFENLSWEIHDDRCVGLVGANGCGKSTLLRLIAGELASESGFTTRAQGLTVGYLRQEPRLNPEHSVWEEALGASRELASVEVELNRVESLLAQPAVYGDERRLSRTLAQQSRLLDTYARLGGPGYEGRVRSTLVGLGFDETGMSLPVTALSGGQKKLVGLAKQMVTHPDLLLLDEPDNHLDLAGKAFLEQFIIGYGGGVIIVSHDRYLLDQVVDEIVEVEDGVLVRYPGASYSEYAVEKELRLLRQQRAYEAQQKEVARIEAAISRFEEWASRVVNERHARQARSRRRMLDRMDRIDRPVLDRRQMDLKLDGWRGSNQVLEISAVSKSFPAESGIGQVSVLDEIDLLVWRGERVGMVGPNAAGKSVLFRIVLGLEQPSGGVVRIGPSVTVGYYAQEHETLDYDHTLIETVRHTASLSEPAAVGFLGRFLFNYDQARGLVRDLSGGERSRLQLALLMLGRANFLLLDEPTNNLDIASAEVLEHALAGFDGTVLLISHDRYFLDRVVDRVVELEQGTLTEYIGGYSDYLTAKVSRADQMSRQAPRR